MAQTFAQKMVALLQDALTKNIGVGSVSVDGQTVSFSSREQLLAEYDRWSRKVVTSSSSGRGRMKTWNLS